MLFAFVAAASVATAATDVSCMTQSGAQMAAEGPMQRIAPAAIEWAQARSRAALAHGRPLAADEVALARSVGVRHPEKVRLEHVDRIELPEAPALREAASRVGLVPASAGGMTLGHGVVIVRSEAADRRLLAHELRHVAQYEACGGIAAFLTVHLQDLARLGYVRAPFEEDARAHERARALDPPPAPGS